MEFLLIEMDSRYVPARSTHVVPRVAWFWQCCAVRNGWAALPSFESSPEVEST